MRRKIWTTVAAAAGTIVLAAPAASAGGPVEFKADFHDNLVCSGFDECGNGVVHGFGTASTTVVFTSFAPADGCVVATAERVATLDSDGSSLLLSLVGTICGHKLAGTFTIVGGTGVFTAASGGGTLFGVATGVPGVTDSVHLRGTITVAGEHL